jgi:hypothetical protein
MPSGKNRVNYRYKNAQLVDLRSMRLKSSENGIYPVKILEKFKIDNIDYCRIHYIGFGKKFDEVRKLSDIVIRNTEFEPGSILIKFCFKLIFHLFPNYVQSHR